MAGSNGSPAQRGGPPPHWPAENEEQAHALEMERWRQLQAEAAAQQGYAHPNSGHHGYQQPAPGYGQPAPFDPAHLDYPAPQGDYAPPHGSEAGAPVRDPFAPPFGESVHRQEAHHAPHLQDFAPVPSPHDYPGAYDPHQLGGVGREHVQDPFAPQQPPHQFDGHRGFDPNQDFGAPGGHPVDPHSGQLDARADPQSWDFSNYHPSQIPQGYHDQAGVHDPHAPPEWGTPTTGAHEAQWPQLQGAPGHWGPEGEFPQGQHYDPNAPGQHPHYPFDSPYDHDQHLGAEPLDEEYGHDLPEEPRRGPSVVLVIGMLVGAIVVGGGLAFAYRHFNGGGHLASLAEIKRQTAPEKVRPEDPGGKTIEHSDNAFLNRGSESKSAETRQSDIDGSAKKVSTIPIVVNRDGSLSPQSSNGSAAPSGSGVPGLVLDGLGPPPGAPQLKPAVTPPETQQASRMPPPPPSVEQRPPRVADLPLPKVLNAPQETASVEDDVPPPVRKPAVPRRQASVAHRTAASGVGASELAAAPRKSAPSISRSGYVAVLASKRTRQEALNAFADLHSEYPQILGSVTPDVREANLGEKGVWYRLIGGPPGSKETARDLCSKLKARGMSDCWPVAY